MQAPVLRATRACGVDPGGAKRVDAKKSDHQNTALAEAVGKGSGAGRGAGESRHSFRSSNGRLILAFAAVYLIWGSTYLGIKFAIQTIPPLLMAGTRYVIAGTLLYLWSRWRGAGPPTREQWRSATVLGALLFLGGNGALTWAEERLDSGLASLLIASTPFWMVLIGHAQHRARHQGGVLGRRVIAGLLLGSIGIGLLVGPGNLLGRGGVDHVAAGVVLCGALAWSAGSIYSPQAHLPRSTLLAAAMEMLCGGALLIVVGLLTRESTALDVSAISGRSILGISYLVAFGSLLGFTSYNWLLSHASPARVATYAYVNPVIAVFLGWAIAHEQVTLRTLVAAALVVAAVALIITHQARPAPAPVAAIVAPPEAQTTEEEITPALPLD